MWLPCACTLAKTVKEGKPTSLADIQNHWKRLQFDAAHLCMDEVADLSLLPELEVLLVLKLIFLLISLLYAWLCLCCCMYGNLTFTTCLVMFVCAFTEHFVSATIVVRYCNIPKLIYRGMLIKLIFWELN
jgi:hypothetical protein